jgi:hypothetical protein
MNYIDTQLFKVAPYPLYDGSKNGQLSLKITSERGATNWLDITPAQMRAIEAVLRPYLTTKHKANR